MEAEIGMSLGQARAAVSGVEWVYEPRFMVDISALCASDEGERLFCALVWAEEEYRDYSEIFVFVVLSGKLTAQNGVRVGMPLDEAARHWGAPTLGYSLDNEGREFIFFENGPVGILARGGFAEPGDETFGERFGVYPVDENGVELQRTEDYRPGTTIGSLWVF